MANLARDPAERSAVLRAFYRDWRPTRLGKLNTAVWAWMAAHSLTPSVLVALQVRGRRSGRLRTSVLVATEHQGARFLVSMLGDESEWVRNARAANGEAFLQRSGTHPVKLIEVPASERGPILKAYCRVATSGRRHFPVSQDAPVSAFEAVAARYPVFRIVPCGPE
jgi:hypothetical protein